MVTNCDSEILGTPLAWETVEAELRTSLKTEARFGPSRSVGIIGDGKGFASSTGMITCDWIGMGDEEKLPEKVLIKIPSSLSFRKLHESTPEEERKMKFSDEEWAKIEKNMKVRNNIEVATYDFFEKFSDLQLPKKYYAKKCAPGQLGFICLEYMDNSETMEFFKVYNVELLTQISRALGQFGAASINGSPSSPEFECGLADECIKMFTSTPEMYRALLGWDSSEKTKEIVEKVISITGQYNDPTTLSTIHKKMGIKPVLVAGDCHTGNVLIDSKSGNLAAIIDWQSTHLGVGIEDLIRIMLFSLSAADRRKHTSQLIREYYNALVENLDGTEAPYTLEKLNTVYDMIFPQCALFFVGCVTLFMKRIEGNASLKPETKKHIISVVMDKCIGGLEDILEMHAKNNNQ